MWPPQRRVRLRAAIRLGSAYGEGRDPSPVPPTKEETKIVKAIGTNAERACRGLDAHKDSIRAPHLTTGGTTLRT